MVVVGLHILLLPAYLAQLRTVCTAIRCALAQPSPASAGALQSLGLSIAGYAGLTLAVSLLSSLICFAVAGVIVWRKSDDWMALVVALVVVALGTALVPNQLETGRTPWQLPALAVDILNFALLFLVFALFPSGRFVPRWTRWLVSGWAVAVAAVICAFLVSGELWIDAYDAVWLVATAGVIIAQVYRYRVVSGARARPQTRWVAFGGSAALVVSMALTAPTLLVPALGRPGSFFELLSPPVGALTISAFALSMGMAVLRSHLYGIDVIIRRTVIYGVVTSALAVVYVSVLALLQAGFRAVTGQGNPVAIADSTLAIFGLFQPVRIRVRATVDRRFYRHRYNAARTLAAFGATVRGDVDLAQLRERLVDVVNETMRPQHVSLWLAAPRHAADRGPAVSEPARPQVDREPSSAAASAARQPTRQRGN